ncbi:MAG TPA: sugar transferase [Beijerinckiaceae bacterium]|nr:sugar transferase [Beijerinckiaceae bacterium]
MNLVGRPLSPADVLIKRSFDIVISAGALVLLSSLFLIMAILIKLDSPRSGPVLTASLRFQTGAVPDRKVPYDDELDDDRHVTHTSENDSRITRIGRWMRRYNIR